MRRYAHRPANVTPELQRRAATGNRRRTATRGATRSARHVPGVVGHAIHGVEALYVTVVQRHIRLPHNDRPCLFQPLYGRRITVGDMLGTLRLPHRRRQTCDGNALLHGHRQPQQRTMVLTTRKRCVRLTRRTQRTLAVTNDDRIDRCLQARDALEAGPHQFHGAAAPLAQRLQLCCRRRPGPAIDAVALHHRAHKAQTAMRNIITPPHLPSLIVMSS